MNESMEYREIRRVGSVVKDGCSILVDRSDQGQKTQSFRTILLRIFVVAVAVAVGGGKDQQSGAWEVRSVEHWGWLGWKHAMKHAMGIVPNQRKLRPQWVVWNGRVMDSPKFPLRDVWFVGDSSIVVRQSRVPQAVSCGVLSCEEVSGGHWRVC